MSEKIYRWEDRTGMVHMIPQGSCVICEHGTDVFLDPWHNNRIYAVYCELGLESTPEHNCPKYKQESKYFKEE